MAQGPDPSPGTSQGSLWPALLWLNNNHGEPQGERHWVQYGHSLVLHNTGCTLFNTRKWCAETRACHSRLSSREQKASGDRWDCWLVSTSPRGQRPQSFCRLSRDVSELPSQKVGSKGGFQAATTARRPATSRYQGLDLDRVGKQNTQVPSGARADSLTLLTGPLTLLCSEQVILKGMDKVGQIHWRNQPVKTSWLALGPPPPLPPPLAPG